MKLNFNISQMSFVTMGRVSQNKARYKCLKEKFRI